MAEASDNLKAVMARHPEIKKLAEQKEAMRQALIAKGISEDSLDDFTKYTDILNAFSFSIDSTIEANNYTYNFGTEDEPINLSSLLADLFDYSRCLADKGSYKSGDFKNDNDILYLTQKPLASNMDYFCYEANGLLYIPQLDFSNVTSANRIFSNNSNCLLDEYTFDLSSCINFTYPNLGFAKKIIFKNMGNTCAINALFYNNEKTEVVTGVNFSNPTTRSNVMLAGATNLTHIEQCDDSVIRCANVLSSCYDEPSSADTTFDKFDAETLYGFCTHAYNWETNPRNYTRINGANSDGNRYCTNYYNYHLSDTAKSKLSEAYPDVDFSSMMEEKGWIY